MRIAVIGGGFTGLTAAYYLAKNKHQVVLFEKETHLGGLAAGFKRPNWDWYLESSYHHLFANDSAILGLIKELGLANKLMIKRPITAALITEMVAGRRQPETAQGGAIEAAGIFQLDSPLHLFTFPYLNLLDKLRTAALLAFCKLNPFWQPLEGVTAKKLFKTLGGAQAWKVIWEPLMVGKFGNFNQTIAAAWLWARIKKRTPRLTYIEGGFHTLVEALEGAITKNGGKIYTQQEVSRIKHQVSRKKNPLILLNTKHQSFSFDRVLLTVPSQVALKLVPQFQISNFKFQIEKIPHLHAQTLILETREPILKDVYWLNVTDRSFPFLAVVAHTNFMDRKYYGGHHLTYFGNYLPPDHPYLSLSANELLTIFRPYIQKLNPAFNFKFQILNFKLFVGFYAQPVHQLYYSRRAPRLDPPTGATGIYLANLDSIYPWDRGTNYAVELGQKAAIKIMAAAK